MNLKSMKSILLLACVALFSLHSIAQIPANAGARGGSQNINMGHFYGKVVDATNKGIDGVTIQLKGSKMDPTTKKSTEAILGTMMSASNGDFSFENLPVMGNFKLMISAIGFKKIERT